MTGYVRKDTTNNIADGNVINAADLDAEFDGIQDAFNASTGHNHDGTSGEGAPITALGPTQDVTISATLLAPKTTNTVDIGSSALKFKDLFLAGNGSIGGTLAVTGVATFTAQPILSSLTASRAVFSDGSKGLVSNAITGTGNVVMSASPTLTGTIDAAALTASGNLTLSGGTANGVAYLNGSKVVTSGSALTFNGTSLTIDGGTAGYLYGPAGELMIGEDASGLYIGNGGGGVPAIPILFGSTATTYQRFNAGGSEQMRLTSTGLGIGTSSPSSKLDIVGVTQWQATAGTVLGKLTYSGGEPVVLANTGLGLQFFTNNAFAAKIDSSGNLGIGTSSPVSPLTVAGTASVNWAGGASSTGTATIGTQGTGGSLLVQTPSVNASYASGFGVDGTYSVGKSVINLKALGTSSGGPYSADMAFFTSTNTTLSEKMRLDSSGNLGLGVTPSAWGSTWKAIQVGMGGSIFARTADQNRIGITANAFFDTAFKYIGTGQATFYDQDDGNHYWYNAPSGTAGNAITFTQAMTLTANGELMVGTTTATGKASIAGAITATASSALVNPSVGVFGLYTGGAIPNTYVQMPSGGSIDFWKADTGVAARIDSSGNLGLGVTPSAWDGALKAIQVNTQGVFASETSAVHVMTNVYYNSGYKYIGTGYATDYYQYNGLHAWRTASSGTAGNAITWTQAMTLGSSGDLLLGTTTNRLGEKLHVLGNGIVTSSAENTNMGLFGTFGSANLIIGAFSNLPVEFRQNNTERMRIDSSGNLLVGTTDNGGTNTEGLEVYIGGGGTRLYVGHANGTANGTQYVVFNYNGTNQIGSISQSGTTAVLYNTTSDQRLKENIQDADSASSLIDALQVRKFDWKADGSHQRYGFVAQELATVYPEAVHQPQDTEQMMAVDYSKLVPLLVKEIQSLKARLDAANL